MFLNVIILLIIVWGLYKGYHQGFVNEIINLFGYIVSYLGAFIYAKPLAKMIWGLIDHSNYLTVPSVCVTISFFIIFTIIWQIFRLVKKILTPITKLPVVNLANRLLGGLTGGVIRYLVLFLVIHLLLLFPVKIFEDQYNESQIAQFIINQTPVISNQITNQFTVYKNEVNI